jgi:hypothetical protein
MALQHLRYQSLPPQYFPFFNAKTLDYLIDSQAFVGFNTPQYSKSIHINPIVLTS